MEKKTMKKKSVRTTIVEQIKEESKEPAETISPRVEFITSGSTVLNLAASQKGIDGGWARGRIINIVGDGSSGKCVKKGRVLTSKGLQILDNIGFALETGITPFEEELSLTRESISKVNAFYKEKVTETVYVKTRHGYEIEGTHNHKIGVWEEDCTVRMKRLEDLKVGDIAVIVRDTQRFPTEYFPITGLKSYSLVPKPNSTSHKPISLPDVVTPDLGSILGMLLADGGFTKNRIDLSNTKKWFKAKLDESLSKLNLKRGKQNTINHWKLAAVMRELCGNPEKFTARYKYVPECILQSPKDVQVEFIRCLLDCDSYSNGRDSIEWSSASEEVAKQLHLMLLNFGIVSTLSSKHGVFDGVNYHDHTYWGINIYGPDFIKYAREIGSYRWDLSKTLEKKAVRKSKYDSIPFLQNYAISERDRIRDKIGWIKNGKMKFRNGRFPRFLFAGTEDLTYERLSVFIDTYKPLEDVWDLSLYKNLLKENYHFDTITSIDYRNEVVEVCDVHVPGDHLFWCNGFINHNTLLALEACAHAFYGIKDIRSDIFPPVTKISIVYNNVEGVMDFPIEQMYGEEFVNDIEWIQTDTCEAFGKDYQKRVRALKPGEFLLYVIDSLDATISEAAKERMAKTLDDKKPDASYGMEKAKFFSQDFFGHLCGSMEGKDATLICISQVRENIGVTFGEKYRRVGGKALDFFTHQVAWIATIEKLKKTFRSQTRVFGVKVKARFKRNKVAKPFREAEFTILFDYGLDDIGSMLDYLYGPEAKEITWKEEIYKRKDFTKLITKFETNPDDLNLLKSLVEKDWNEIEVAIAPKRKNRWKK